jgi:excisionase family DNA binding protein
MFADLTLHPPSAVLWTIHADVANVDAGTAKEMTFKEAAALLRVDPSTLRKQAHRKRLRATRKGRDWHVTRGEVERYRREVSRKGKTSP